MPTIICKITDTPILETKALGKAFFVSSPEAFPESTQKLFGAHAKSLMHYAAQQNFTGEMGTSLILPVVKDDSISTIIILGLGARQGKDGKDGISVENYRRAIGSLIRLSESLKLDTLAITLPTELIDSVSAQYLAEQTALIAHMAVFKHDEFITTKKPHGGYTLEISVPKAELEKTKAAVEKGTLLATMVNRTRDWIDTPPSRLTPPHLADYALEIAERHKMPITIFDEPTINKMGMGGLAGVSVGSELDCRFVAMEYWYDKKAPTIAFVGKGITFDSGGLSIKPAESMENMKDDMSGAACVINAMDAIATLKPKVNVIGIAPLAENLPSGNAVKPGDVLKFYNGMTAEVKNTDAEGRLILADALSYAVKHYSPDAIIDIATLTGACAFALGPFYAGIMGKDEELLARVEKASKTTGERVWRLPFDDDYKPAIRSNIADLSNIGSRRYNAGAITAGFFLYPFVNNTPWVHIDIAGPAYDVPDISYFRPQSATGAGVRLLVELACTWVK
ncbi:MAG: leucyl aminopeptidase [Candidatus Babeliales bacterium]